MGGTPDQVDSTPVTQSDNKQASEAAPAAPVVENVVAVTTPNKSKMSRRRQLAGRASGHPVGKFLQLIRPNEEAKILNVQQYDHFCINLIHAFQVEVKNLRIHKVQVPAGPPIHNDMTLRQVSELQNRYANAHPVLGGYVVTFEYDNQMWLGACEISYDEQRRGKVYRNRAIWTAIRFAVAPRIPTSGNNRFMHGATNAANRVSRKHWSHQRSLLRDTFVQDALANRDRREQAEAKRVLEALSKQPVAAAAPEDAAMPPKHEPAAV